MISPRMPGAKKHDIVYRQPALRTEDYLPLGNGQTGILVDPLGSQSLGGYISKTDLWYEKPLSPDYWDQFCTIRNAREAYAGQDWEYLAEMQSREKARSEQFKAWRKPLIAGQAAVELAVGGCLLNRREPLQDYEQSLSLDHAEVNTRFRWKGVETKARAIVHSDCNIMMWQYSDRVMKDGDEAGTAPQPHLRLERRIRLGKRAVPEDTVSYGAERNLLWFTYEASDGVGFAVAARVEGAAISVIRGDDSSSSSPYLVASAAGEAMDITVYVAVASEEEADDPLQACLRSLEHFAAAGPEEAVRLHRHWWRSFWQQSAVELSDPDIENLWYTQNYLLAASSRGDFPPGLCMLWPAEDPRPWTGPYYDMNVCLMYSSAMMINAPELAEPFFRLYEHALEGAKMNARRLYGMEGAQFPHNFTKDGVELSFMWWRYENYHGALAALLFWFRYVYSGDVTFLRERAYPFMKEVGAFYAELVKLDSGDGVYHFPVPNCSINENSYLNTVFLRKDNPFDLSIVKRLFLNLVAGSKLLGTDEAERAVWEDVIEHLAPLPAEEEVYLNYAGEDPRNLDDHVQPRFVVTDCMGPLYPAGVADVRDPRWKNTIFDAVAYGGGVQCFSWPWIASAAAVLGEGYVAARCLHAQMKKHLLPSGQIGEDGGKGFPYIEAYRRAVPGVLIGESGPWSSSAICLMLLGSLYDGCVRLFPAIPGSWDARFDNLRAAGGFLVSSERMQGTTSFVKIQSLAGLDCSIELPRDWQVQGKEDVAVFSIIGQAGDHPDNNPVMEMVDCEVRDGCISFGTFVNRSYFVHPRAASVDYHDPFAEQRVAARGGVRYVGLPAGADMP